jgi:anaerobic sulfite reductase subunit C
MKWADDAEKVISRAPFFVRKRVKKQVEEEACRQGAPIVLLCHVHACQKKYMEDMENEVRGHQVETCFGPSGCPNRAVTGEGIFDDLERLLNVKNLRAFLLQKVDGPLKLHHEFRISISDCPNCCSRPQIADIGILGACQPKLTDSDCTNCEACIAICREDALRLELDEGPVLTESRCVLCGQCANGCPSGTLIKGLQGYRIQLGGKLGRHPQLAQELGGIYTKEEVFQMVERCIDHYMHHCRRGERFGEVLNRAPLNPIDYLQVS